MIPKSPSFILVVDEDDFLSPPLASSPCSWARLISCPSLISASSRINWTSLTVSRLKCARLAVSAKTAVISTIRFVSPKLRSGCSPLGLKAAQRCLRRSAKRKPAVREPNQNERPTTHGGLTIHESKISSGAAASPVRPSASPDRTGVQVARYAREQPVFSQPAFAAGACQIIRRHYVPRHRHSLYLCCCCAFCSCRR